MTLAAPPRPPRLPGVPLLGNAPAFMRDAVGVLRLGSARLGPVFALRLGPRTAAVVTGPAQSRAVLGLPGDVLSLRPVYKWVIPMFGEVLQAALPSDYRDQRAAVLPAFQGRHLDGYGEIMRAETEAWLGSLGARGTFDAVRDLERLSLDIAVRTYLGPAFRAAATDEFRRLYHDVAAGMEFFLPPNLPLPRLRRRDRAKAGLLAQLRPELAAARANPDPAEHGFLAHLVAGRSADGRPLSDQTLVGLVGTLVFAAYETTAAQLAWALVLLLRHPAALDQVRAELDSGTDRRRWLHWCLLEAERVRPITTMIWRHTERPYEVGGFTVPAGWVTILSPPVTHRDPQLYPSPDAFDPARFSPGRDPDGRAAGGLLTFGGGEHRCLGIRFADLEMDTVLTALLRRYELSLVDPDPRPARRMGVSRPESPCLVRYRPVGARASAE